MNGKRYSEWRSRGIIKSAQSKMRSNTMLSCLWAFAYAGCSSRSTVPLSYRPALTYLSDLSLVIPLLLHLLSHFDTARRFTLRSITKQMWHVWPSAFLHVCTPSGPVPLDHCPHTRRPPKGNQILTFLPRMPCQPRVCGLTQHVLGCSCWVLSA